MTERQRIFNGCLVINDDFGFSFVLPHPYDEIADSVGDIPLDLIFDEIYVSDFSAWNPSRRD
ncbi:hypothethical protein (plasmid) [Ralstonia solanacearum CMR15]|nr:hypothethical protein [Ralstonia solanacearum CMR15]